MTNNPTDPPAEKIRADQFAEGLGIVGDFAAWVRRTPMSVDVRDIFYADVRLVESHLETAENQNP